MVKANLPTPPPEALIHEDDQLYVALASFPITKGHVVVVWRDDVDDLHLLSDEQYRHLMGVVDKVRDSMLKVLQVEKVYLIYMDETKHVHWHLVPRYNEKGFDVFEHEPGELTEFSLANEVKRELIF